MGQSLPLRGLHFPVSTVRRLDQKNLGFLLAPTLPLTLFNQNDPRDSLVLIPEPGSVTLYSKNDFEDRIKDIEMAKSL